MMKIYLFRKGHIMNNEILILHPAKANLPELQAYSNYFSEVYNVTISTDYTQDISKFDIIWIIMGTKSIKKRRRDQILIHEYASLSTGKFPRAKNFIKKVIVNRPDIRIFLNEFVKKEMGFKDNIEYCFRDMGISKLFLDKEFTYPIKYDFVYVGDISKERKMDIFLKNFIVRHNTKLLLVGNYDIDIYNNFVKYDNLTFAGKVPYDNVPQKILQARYAINFIPNEYPYNLQTSTKLQEYIALGMNVITTDGEWVRSFEKENDCKFFYMNIDGYSFDDGYKSFEYKSFLNGSDYLWESVLEESGILKTIESFEVGKDE